MSFYTYDSVYCPNCKPVYRKSNSEQRVGVHLEYQEHNYSGCSVDIAECPVCEKTFQIS